MKLFQAFSNVLVLKRHASFREFTLLPEKFVLMLHV